MFHVSLMKNLMLKPLNKKKKPSKEIVCDTHQSNFAINVT